MEKKDGGRRKIQAREHLLTSTTLSKHTWGGTDSYDWSRTIQICSNFVLLYGRTYCTNATSQRLCVIRKYHVIVVSKIEQTYGQPFSFSSRSSTFFLSFLYVYGVMVSPAITRREYRLKETLLLLLLLLLLLHPWCQGRDTVSPFAPPLSPPFSLAPWCVSCAAPPPLPLSTLLPFITLYFLVGRRFFLVRLRLPPFQLLQIAGKQLNATNIKGKKRRPRKAV